jgi:hypothetical protein
MTQARLYELTDVYEAYHYLYPYRDLNDEGWSCFQVEPMREEGGPWILIYVEDDGRFKPWEPLLCETGEDGWRRIQKALERCEYSEMLVENRNDV